MKNLKTKKQLYISRDCEWKISFGKSKYKPATTSLSFFISILHIKGVDNQLDYK
jgi:hypothetical protein